MPRESSTSLDRFVAEANRQLTICNACRYCEGYCAVFPALERRNVLDGGDLAQLANLCHDCRACFDACMYAPPHQFSVNVPNALASVRLETYDRYVWPSRLPRPLRGWAGLLSTAVLAAAVLVLIALAHAGPAALIARPDGAASPYALTPYPVLLAVVLVPSVFTIVVTVLAARRYWRDVGGSPGGSTAPAVWRAAGRAMTLRYLRGGGAGCPYPDDEVPSPARRRLHHAVMYGFGLCIVSTVSAGVLQDIVGHAPPYPVLSVPVVTGVIGGLGMVIGCTALLLLKRRSSATTSVATMTVKDYGLLAALGFLAVSGLAVLVVRDTRAFPVVYLAHMTAVVLAFAVAPYSKLVHLVFRFLALVRDDLERARASGDGRPSGRAETA